MSRAAPVFAALLLGTFHTAGAQSPRVELDVPYITGAGASQSLDIYTPATSKYPTLIFLHGGSLSGGDKRDQPTDSICHNVVLLGIGCISANYRLAGDARWPAMPNDVADAVAWVARHIRERGGDSTRLFLVGHSSGCMLVSLIATDPRYLAARHMTPAAIAGVVAMGCLLGDSFDTTGMGTDRVRKFFAENGYLKLFGSLDTLLDAAPMSHVSKSMPPMLITIAEAEQVNPPILEQAHAFVARAKAIGATRVPAIVVLPNRRHITALNLMANPGDPTLALIAQFIRTGVLPPSFELKP